MDLKKRLGGGGLCPNIFDLNNVGGRGMPTNFVDLKKCGGGVGVMPKYFINVGGGGYANKLCGLEKMLWGIMIMVCTEKSTE